MLQHPNSGCRWIEQAHDSCEPPRAVGLSFHYPHHLAIPNRFFAVLRSFVRAISPLECPVSGELDVPNFKVVTQTALSPAAHLPTLVVFIDHRRANFRRTPRKQSNGVLVPQFGQLVRTVR